MTPSQKQTVHQRSTINAERYTAMLDWYINESGHPGYTGLQPNDRCPQATFIKDTESTNNTSDPGNPEIENVFVNGTFEFSIGQEMSCTTSVCDTAEQFC